MAQKVFRLQSKYPDKPRILSVCFNTVNEKIKVMELAKKYKLVAKDLDTTFGTELLYISMYNSQSTIRTYRLMILLFTLVKIEI